MALTRRELYPGFVGSASSASRANRYPATIAFYETLGFRPRITPSYVVMEPVPAVS